MHSSQACAVQLADRQEGHLGLGLSRNQHDPRTRKSLKVTAIADGRSEMGDNNADRGEGDALRAWVRDGFLR